MDCPPISNLTFDAASREGLAQIRSINSLSQLLAVGAAAGHLVNIFAGNGSLEAMYSISSTNWAAFAKAMRGIPDIARNRVQLEARRQILTHGTDPKQQRFWRGVLNGCSTR